ncbi:MAG: family 43 glycosylhydrolase [Bacteroidota bacterium]
MLGVTMVSCASEWPSETQAEDRQATEFPFESHDVSELVAVGDGVYTAFSSANPNTLPDRLRQFVLDVNDPNPQWTYIGHWPVQTDRSDFAWHTSWMAQYGYDPDTQIEHTEVTATAPSPLDAKTVYFHVYNPPGRAWAAENGKEPAMFAALYRATASGTYPDQRWAMEPVPVYYSDDTTWERRGPRAVDANVWTDESDELFMTFGSWDPEGGNVIVIAEMDERTGRIEGFDATTPGYYPKGGLGAFHTVATFGEGAFTFQRGGYYYLFLSLGGCCNGVESTYYTVVGRSENVFGPYVDREGRSFSETYDGAYPGTVVASGVKGETRFIGPGHPGVLEIDGRLCFTFHYYDADDAGTAKLGTRELQFDDQGWPYIASEEPFRFR